MNQLNSVIMEGKIVTDDLVTESEGVFFAITSNRYIKTGGRPRQEVTRIWVQIPPKLDYNLKKGTSVRVVGYLAQRIELSECGSNHYKIVIVAEHLEVKPTKS